MRSWRVGMATICRAYSLGHVTVVSRNRWQGQAQLFGQPCDTGLTYPGRLAVLHAEFSVEPVAVLNP